MGNMIPVGTGMFKVLYDETLKEGAESCGLVVSAPENEMAFDDVQDIVKEGAFVIQQ